MEAGCNNIWKGEKKMTTGYLMIGSGMLLLATAVLMTIAAAVTVPGRRRKMEARMKEKY